jgi:hypothetical protein
MIVRRQYFDFHDQIKIVKFKMVPCGWLPGNFHLSVQDVEPFLDAKKAKTTFSNGLHSCIPIPLSSMVMVSLPFILPDPDPRLRGLRMLHNVVETFLNDTEHIDLI